VLAKELKYDLDYPCVELGAKRQKTLKKKGSSCSSSDTPGKLEG